MERLLENLKRFHLESWKNEFETLVNERRTFLDQRIGNFGRFQKVLDQMPDIVPSDIDLDGRYVQIGSGKDISKTDLEIVATCLEQLCPWRKGPFRFFDINVDSEWQSWMKWDRLIDHIQPLENAKILDIGSSNGYYMFRMAHQKPLMVLGVEPQSSFYYQYLALQKYLRLSNVHCLPVPHDRLPKIKGYFDTVFCMGILYHRQNPVGMLKEIRESLRPRGELVLENLVVEGEEGMCLFPQDRYAKMRNVFFIPDPAAMTFWLERAGFSQVRCVDICRTTPEEQRKTKWIQTETLKDFLDPDDPDKTIEGYPAPVRAVFIASTD